VLSGENCPCGRAAQLLQSIEGRDNDVIITSEGQVVHSEILAYINRDLLKKGFLISEYKIIQKAVDELRVLVPRETEERALFALRRQIRAHTGQEMRIGIELTDEIPRERSGKVRYFVSELNL
jgi:phenylacetate-CoA ligase